MADPESRSPKENRSRNGGDPNFNWRGVLLLAISIALIGGFFLTKSGPLGAVEEISNPRFDQLLESGKIVKDRPLELVVEDGRPTQYVRGYYARAGTTW